MSRAPSWLLFAATMFAAAGGGAAVIRDGGGSDPLPEAARWIEAPDVQRLELRGFARPEAQALVARCPDAEAPARDVGEKRQWQLPVCVTGLVLSRGVPVAGARLSFDCSFGGLAEVSATADAYGRYATVLTVEGTWCVEARRHDGQLVAVRWFTPGKERLSFFVVEAFEGSLRGIVLEAVTGARVPDARIDLGNGRSTRSDSDGFFVLDELSAGSFELAIEKDGFAPARTIVHLAEGQEISDLRVALEPPSVLRGTVLTRDGTPITARCRVVVRREGGGVLGAGRVRSDGRFEIGLLPSGAAKVYLQRFFTCGMGASPAAGLGAPPEAELWFDVGCSREIVLVSPW